VLALQKQAPGFGVITTQVDEPGLPSDHEVIIAVEAASICGSDLHVYDWSTDSYAWIVDTLPCTLGHEFAGRVVARGVAVKELEIGARVTGFPGLACGVCAQCRDAHPERCTDKQGSLGLTRPGAMAPLLKLPEVNCFRLPDTVDFELGSIVEPLVVGLNAVDIGEVKEGDRVLVMGAGPIAQGIALFARSAGASAVTVTGFNDTPRLDVFRKLGFSDLIDRAGEGSMEKLKAKAGAGFDVVFEATGAPHTLAEGLSVLKRFGIFVATGIHSGPATFNLTDLVRRRIQLRGSYSPTPRIWRNVIAAVAADPEAFRPIITHRVPLTEAVHGFELAHQREASKVVLLPQTVAPRRTGVI
jgi:threonine dehydrogenase-like Zn-dependent dehydrogenase